MLLHQSGSKLQVCLSVLQPAHTATRFLLLQTQAADSVAAADHEHAFPHFAVVANYARIGKDEILETVFEGSAGLLGLWTIERL